jgi:hypothetical protein
VFCEACGRNLAEVERLPTAAEWSPGPGRQPAVTVADATAAFLGAMHAAGDPGAAEIDAGRPSLLGRTRKVRGWVVRAVEREDFQPPRRYEPGLVLSVDGHYHRLDSELRGYGQRDFPTYHHSVSVDPIETPQDERLVAELAALEAAIGI